MLKIHLAKFQMKDSGLSAEEIAAKAIGAKKG